IYSHSIMGKKILNRTKIRRIAGMGKRTGKRFLGYLMYPYRSRFRPRKFHSFCVGTMKSGTTSMSGLFHPFYRAAHEPESQLIISLMNINDISLIEHDKLIDFFLRRDKRLWLEFESSHEIANYVKILVKAFENAKFILTIRDCYSWLDSAFNNQINHNFSKTSTWNKMYDIYFRPDIFSRSEHEQMFINFSKKLYTLDGYLSFWAAHNNKVLNSVPKNRLLILRTHEISREIDKIEKFLGIPLGSLNQTQSHLRKAKRKWRVISKINPNFLERKVDQYCRDLMDEYFPEISCYEDSLHINKSCN
ncbi:sulfotransferase, partial [Chloroflexota bacterium]